MVIFPEGTRNSGGPLGEFKAGAIRMATRAGVPVVPVCIDGSHLLMKKGSLWIHPAKVNIRILPPISTEGMARDEIRDCPSSCAGRFPTSWTVCIVRWNEILGG